jgi:hypothetical protein
MLGGLEFIFILFLSLGCGTQPVKPEERNLAWAKEEAQLLIAQEMKGNYLISICLPDEGEFQIRTWVAKENGWTPVNYSDAVFPKGAFCQIFAKGPELQKILATQVAPATPAAKASQVISLKKKKVGHKKKAVAPAAVSPTAKPTETMSSHLFNLFHNSGAQK